MIGTLILTHGALARELLNAAQVIAGDLPNFDALCLDWEDGQEEASEKILASIARLDQGDGILILTDMYGGTPFNVARQFAQEGRIEVLCGVNLPMVLRVGCRSGGGCERMQVGELAAWLQGKGKQSIRRVTPAADPERRFVPGGVG